MMDDERLYYTGCSGTRTKCCAGPKRKKTERRSRRSAAAPNEEIVFIAPTTRTRTCSRTEQDIRGVEHTWSGTHAEQDTRGAGRSDGQTDRLRISPLLSHTDCDTWFKDIYIYIYAILIFFFLILFPGHNFAAMNTGTVGYFFVLKLQNTFKYNIRTSSKIRKSARVIKLYLLFDLDNVYFFTILPINYVLSFSRPTVFRRTQFFAKLEVPLHALLFGKNSVVPPMRHFPCRHPHDRTLLCNKTIRRISPQHRNEKIINNIP